MLRMTDKNLKGIIVHSSGSDLIKTGGSDLWGVLVN
ncbi:MAG: hypothetical protein XD96_0935 [Petrotoga mobilis]|nr:MAG: hypothetical protein XD96_0935 [Petrotoga mobilis]